LVIILFINDTIHLNNTLFSSSHDYTLWRQGVGYIEEVSHLLSSYKWLLSGAMAFTFLSPTCVDGGMTMVVKLCLSVLIFSCPPNSKHGDNRDGVVRLPYLFGLHIVYIHFLPTILVTASHNRMSLVDDTYK
jgi:hypothetical protein